MLRRSCGTFQLLSLVMSRPATMMCPRVGRSSRSSRSRRNVDFPEPDGPDEEHELAFPTSMADVAERDDLALVDLGDVLEADHESDLRVPGHACELWVNGPTNAGDLRRIASRDWTSGIAPIAATAGTPR